MAENVFIRPTARSSDHATASPRANEPPADVQVSQPRLTGGLLRPSQVPVPSPTIRRTGSPTPAGGPAHQQGQRLRPSGAPIGAALLPLARPSTVPARHIQDVLRHPGQPLAAQLKEEMQARLGADLSDVRVHTDGASRASAAEVGARAFTSGNHVVIGDGGADKHTLAHELTHVVQQRQGPVAGTDLGNGFKVSDPFDAYEKAAEVNAARVMRAPLSQKQAQVKPTIKTNDAVMADDHQLQQEADVRGKRAEQTDNTNSPRNLATDADPIRITSRPVPIQATIWTWSAQTHTWTPDTRGATPYPSHLGNADGQVFDDSPAPPLELEHDPHGVEKHFQGQRHTKKGNAQWSLNKAQAEDLMREKVRELEPLLRKNAPAVANKTTGNATFYYGGTADGIVGWSDHRDDITKRYTMQIDWIPDKNKIAYHGYPDKAATDGLRTSKHSKRLDL